MGCRGRHVACKVSQGFTGDLAPSAGEVEELTRPRRRGSQAFTSDVASSAGEGAPQPRDQSLSRVWYGSTSALCGRAEGPLAARTRFDSRGSGRPAGPSHGQVPSGGHPVRPPARPLPPLSPVWHRQMNAGGIHGCMVYGIMSDRSPDIYRRSRCTAAGTYDGCCQIRFPLFPPNKG